MADDFMMVTTLALREWPGFCRTAGKKDWPDHPRFPVAASFVESADGCVPASDLLDGGACFEVRLPLLTKHRASCP